MDRSFDPELRGAGFFLAASPDGRLLAVGGERAPTRVFDLLPTLFGR